MCVYVCVEVVCARVNTGAHRVQKLSDSGVGVIDSYELSDVDTGKESSGPLQGQYVLVITVT